AETSHGETASAVEPHLESGMALAQMRRGHEFIEPEVVPAEVPSPAEAEVEFTDGSVEGDVAKSPADVSNITDASLAAGDTGSVREATAAAGAAPSAEGSAAHVFAESGVTHGQLSPEALETIARRVVELMSEKVVREIAWEVVPDLAELLIKRRLDEEKR
ncbi:MAG: hypothetical protein LC802_02465, partial [Acidobacteria bacterium]|nr:hypothetical protein [Acidobacteriota bacterium]